MDIAGAAAVVTGAASGLGRATAAALAEAGCEVVGVDLEQALDAKLGSAPSARPPRGSVRYLPVDVTDFGQVAALFGDERFEATPLRAVVNCAGVASSERIVGRFGPHDLERFVRVVGINLVGTFAVMAHGAAAMAQSTPDGTGQRGVVVNTASIAAMDGQVGQAAYASSKAGVVGLTLPAARDLSGLGIRVCAIARGIVDTPMMGTVSEEYRAGLAAGVPFPPRLGRPEEYAKLVLSIIDNDYLNGEIIRMDGALRMAAR